MLWVQESSSVLFFFTPLAREGFHPKVLGRLGFLDWGSSTVVGSYRTMQYFCMLLLLVGHHQVIFVISGIFYVSLRAEMVLGLFELLSHGTSDTA